MGIDFDLQRAKQLAGACAAAYTDSPEAIALACGAKEVDTFSYGPVFGFIAHQGNDLIVAFRGTVCPVEDWEMSLRQWITNTDFTQIAALGGRVHRGFYNALDAHWLPFHELVKKHVTPDRQVWITGHSLGGALAILAGIRLHQAGIEVAGIYTFGAPAVGDAAFATNFKQVLHRVENCCDVVCHLPIPKALANLTTKLFDCASIPIEAEYHPVGTVTVCFEGGVRATTVKTEQDGCWWLRLLDNVGAVATDLSVFLEEHRMANYVSRLEKGNARRDRIFFETPRRLLKLFSKLPASGGIFRDASGRRFAVVQETKGWHEVIGGGKPGGMINNSGSLAASLRTDPGVASALSSLQLLSAANLAASVIGIGVSIAGFALVLRRLNNVALIANETKTEAIAARLAAERVDTRAMIAQRANILHLLESAEAAWSYTDPTEEWKGLRRHLHKQMTYEQCLVGKYGTNSIFLDGRFSLEEAVEAYESTLLLNAAHFQTLLLTGEENAALFHVEEFCKWHWDAVVSRLRSDKIAEARAKVTEPDLRSKLRRRADDFLAKAREIHRHGCNRIELVRFILEKGISGRAYIEEARERTDTPFLLLPVC